MRRPMTPVDSINTASVGTPNAPATASAEAKQSCAAKHNLYAIRRGHLTDDQRGTAHSGAVSFWSRQMQREIVVASNLVTQITRGSIGLSRVNQHLRLHSPYTGVTLKLLWNVQK